MTIPPPSRLPRPVNETRPRSLTDDQLRRILEVSTKDPTLRDLRDVTAIMSDTPIRESELSQLRWTDIDFSRRTLLVNSKNGSMALLPCGPKTLQILAARLVREPDTEYVLGRSPRNLLIRVSRQLRTVCAGIGVSGAGLHLLRLTALKRYS